MLQSLRCSVTRCVFTSWVLVGLSLSAATRGQIPPDANTPPEQIIVDGLLAPGELQSLIGQTGIVTLKSSVRHENSRIDSFQFDRRGGGLKFLKIAVDQRRSRTIKASDLYQILTPSRRVTVRYVAPTRQYYLRDQKVAIAQINQRLAETDASFEELPGENELGEANDEIRGFLNQAVESLRPLGVYRVDETDHVFVLSMLPPATVSTIAKQTGRVQNELNNQFGLPQNSMLFRGKPTLAIFPNKQHLGLFEEEAMNNPNHAGIAKLHTRRGSLVQTMLLETLNERFIKGIMWGHILGYYRISMSSSPGFKFIAFGLANLIPEELLPTTRDKTRPKRVAEALRRDRTLYGVLTADDVPVDRRIFAIESAAFLRRTNPEAFRQFVVDSKLGFELDEALQRNFGIDKTAFAAALGRSMGVPGVTP